MIDVYTLKLIVLFAFVLQRRMIMFWMTQSNFLQPHTVDTFCYVYLLSSYNYLQTSNSSSYFRVQLNLKSVFLVWPPFILETYLLNAILFCAIPIFLTGSLLLTRKVSYYIIAPFEVPTTIGICLRLWMISVNF